MPAESKAQRRKRAAGIVAILKKEFPHARTALGWSSPLDLLVATILSAQCTDARVNVVTKDLFRKYKAAADYAGAPQEVLEAEVRPTGFFRNKARNIRAAAARLVAEFGGQVPDTMEKLLTLPGVARKTANVVLGDAFGRQEGIAVDTHVSRLAGRLKLTAHAKGQPEKIESDLMELLPRKDWTLVAHLLIYHGRQTCTARNPACQRCRISRLCPSAFKA